MVTLLDFVSDCTLDRENALDLAFQLIRTMEYVHDLLIMHGDLQPGHIGITENTDGDQLIKIGCWSGAVCICPMHGAPLELQAPQGGCLHYRPLETMFGAGMATLAVDIWSVGCLIAEFFFGEVPGAPGCCT